MLAPVVTAERTLGAIAESSELEEQGRICGGPGGLTPSWRSQHSDILMRALIPALVATIATSGAGAQSPTVAPLQADLKAVFVGTVTEAADRLDGVAGWIVTDLTTKEVVTARNERQPFPTASTIKLSILYELLKQAEAGTIQLDARVPLDRAQVVGGSGVLQHLTTPALSLRDFAALMIILSDNTATNVVIDAVGMGRVNERMAALGLGDIRLRRKMMDAAAVARGDENVGSPASLAAMVERLWRGNELTANSRETARAILRQVSGQIRSAVPGSVPVFEKTGSLTGVRAEAAVVEVKGRPFSIAVMTTYLARDDEGARLIREIASAAHSYFDRLARGGAHGRR
jgi:beta-lactamase class A